MKERFEPFKRLMEVLRVGKNLRAQARMNGHLPDGPELCFPGEIGGHFQLPLIDQTPQDEEIVLFELPQKPAIID